MHIFTNFKSISKLIQSIKLVNLHNCTIINFNTEEEDTKNYEEDLMRRNIFIYLFSNSDPLKRKIESKTNLIFLPDVEVINEVLTVQNNYCDLPNAKILAVNISPLFLEVIHNKVNQQMEVTLLTTSYDFDFVYYPYNSDVGKSKRICNTFYIGVPTDQFILQQH